MRPLVIAHRGASAEAPENTIASFELAVAQGADGIELDVHLSSDGHPVVIHDDTLERTTDGTGTVAARTMRELKRLDAGGWRGEAFRGQRLQTLQEVLERFRERTRFWIELKAGSDRYPDIEERVLTALEMYDVMDRSLVQSFDWRALGRLREMSDALVLGALIEEGPLDPTVPGGVQALNPSCALATDAEVARIRSAGLDCHVWTVNEAPEMDRLIRCGASGIITDRPALLRSRLT